MPKAETAYSSGSKGSTDYKQPYFNIELIYNNSYAYDDDLYYEAITAKRPAAFANPTKSDSSYAKTTEPETDFDTISKTETGFVENSKTDTDYN